ncbi:hypothetical protein [Pantoea sp. S62]|uniref:hypothetical protein n=1 Tax=Pantoea sp. S62 TaxID=2769342 RepID=UPI0019140A1E|nr:hypothetical protein [Pantoea sp. S62]MBK5016684.1 hypothetical protein [Pantoea sp. S62]
MSEGCSGLNKLCFEFFTEFARYEFFLKITGLTQGEGDAKANWDRYALEVEEIIASPDTAELKDAIDYILTHPPKKQIVRNRVLLWDERPVQGRSKAQQVFLLIRRIRNNLFHGGKFNSHWFEPERSELLMQHALIILKICARNHAGVSVAYNSMEVSII